MSRKIDQKLLKALHAKLMKHGSEVHGVTGYIVAAANGATDQFMANLNAQGRAIREEIARLEEGEK
jgi:hypothetical protein